MTQDDEKPRTPPDDEPDRGGAARKERVLHTRVPAVLEQELKRLAHSWRVPVSNVVRVILEDAVSAVDRVGRRAEDDLHKVVERLAQQRERLRTIANDADDAAEPSGEVEVAEVSESENGPPADLLQGVIGYQPLVLATHASCSVCGRPLEAGDEVFLGVRESAGPRVLIGSECLPSKKMKEIEP